MKFVRLVALFTLAFLGTSSLAGGIPLILDPSGRLLHMPLQLLEHSPFSSFLVPGVILLLANGVLSFVVMGIVVRRHQRYGAWIALQGCVLFGWITMEVLLIRSVVWAHFVYWGVALVLIGAGVLLSREQRSAEYRAATRV